MPTTAERPTNDLAQSLGEAEQAAAALAEAQQKANHARQRAEAAQQAAEARQKEAQRVWADREIATWLARRQAFTARVSEARTAFEAAVVTDPTKAATAFIAWTEAMAQRHAAELSYVTAGSILGRDTLRVPQWPRLHFSTEVDGILERHAMQQLDDATTTEKERRIAAFSGKEPAR